ncbi:MAG: nucleotide pyrophosphohydrolase [Candidatus Lokiarchaeota archaeon]
MTPKSNLNDESVNISFFKKKVEDFVKIRKWKKYHNPNNLAQAISIEAAELLEIFLFKDINTNDIFENDNLRVKISEEISDVFIYLISLINALDLDLTKIFIDKMEKNNQKYPKKEFNNGYYKKK